MHPKGNTEGYKVNFGLGEKSGSRPKREKPKKFNSKDFVKNFPLDEWTCWTGKISKDQIYLKKNKKNKKKLSDHLHL